MRRAAAVAVLLAVLLGYMALRRRPGAWVPAVSGAVANHPASSPAASAVLTASPTERAVTSLPAVKLDALRSARPRRRAAEPPPPSP